MKGDFSRLTDDPRQGFRRVLMQQGRVQLDADANEQTAILLRYLQTLAADLIGPHGGPDTGLSRGGGRGGFAITGVPGPNDAPLPDQYQLTPGRYYVDGVLCENAAAVSSKNPGTYLPGELDLKTTPHLLFLDTWEREVTFLQNDSIREVALGGLDTSLRTAQVWRVRAATKKPDGTELPRDMKAADLDDWGTWIKQWQGDNRGNLQAQAKPDTSKETDPCTASPESRYRGLENQLYRVEVHQGTETGKTATFKWSRDNGSVTFAVRSLTGTTAFLENLGKDGRTGLKSGDWVELLDDKTELTGAMGILLQVDVTDGPHSSVELKLPKDVTLDLPEYDEAAAAGRHPYLRRWDHREGSPSKGAPKLVAGALAIREGLEDSAWLTLEDGVQIRFQTGGQYRAGDYWLIPARTATGDVEWPGPVGQPEWRPPQGVEHHYAPLALLSLGADGLVAITDFRSLFPPQAVPVLPPPV
jgi:hypothetical protein